MGARARLQTKRAWVLTLVLLIACAAARAQSGTWKTYSYPADGFSISAPAEPQLSQQDVPTEAGNFTVHMHIVALDSAQLVAAMNDYGSAADGKDSQAIADGAMNGAIGNVKAHLIQSKKIAIGNHPGNSFEAESDQFHFSGRIYIVGSVLYQMMVVTPINQKYADTERFMDSFQLIPRSQK